MKEPPAPGPSQPPRWVRGPTQYVLIEFCKAVTPARYVPTMELPDSHLEVLKTLAGGGGDTDIDPDILADLRKWGMVMPHSLEVTGMGQRYASGGERRLL